MRSHLAVSASENMNPPDSETRCTICGCSQAPNETWFSVTHDPRLDRVSVWQWTWRLSRDPRSHPVCSQKHAKEIILHWMTTGCLHYPFALDGRPSPRPATFVAAGFAATGSGWLAELSVDHDSVRRILGESPWSLNVIFEELAIALGADTADEEEGDCSLPGVLAGRF